MSTAEDQRIRKKSVGGGVVNASGTGSVEHIVVWSDRPWTLCGIFLTLWSTIFFGLCFLNRLHWGINIPISFVVVIGLFFVIWLFKRRILRFLRWSNSQFGYKYKYDFSNEA